MAAFDKICSGLPQLDEALDCIRLGDNLVWQISELEEFRAFAEPFARQAVRDGRNVIYIRFAQHMPVLRMRNKNNKHLGIEIDPELHFKLHYIARFEGRSANGQILYLIRKCIREFEDAEGEIKVPEADK